MLVQTVTIHFAPTLTRPTNSLRHRPLIYRAVPQVGRVTMQTTNSPHRN